MKEKFLKTSIIIISAIFIIGVLASSLNVYADEDDEAKIVEKLVPASEKARSVLMKANGDFTVTGVIVNSVASSTNTINVRFYGFNRDVNVSGAKWIIGGGQKITIADFNPGDRLWGKGNFNENTRVITVHEIHNLSYRTRHFTSIQARIQELLDLVRQLQEKLKNLTR